MSKIQNIDHCWECKEHYDYGGNNLDRCGETGKLLSDIEVIPTWCPLPDKAGWLLIDSCPQDTLVWLWDGCEYGLGFAAQNPLDETATHYRIPSPPETTK
jgi:hypothetical protein